jgi:type VI secretion system protein ImpK
MNDKGRPSNPFGRGDRTIIRPNPGGRLPTAPAPPPPQSPYPPAPPSYPATPPSYPAAPAYPAAPQPYAPPAPAGAPYPNQPPPGYGSPTPSAPYPTPPALPPSNVPPGGHVAAPAPPPPPFQSGPHQYAPAPATHAAEEWISTPSRPVAPAYTGPQGPTLKVDDLVAPNANPIMRAAGPLLLLLGRLRVALLRASFAALMEQVADAVKFFEKDIRSAGIPEHQSNSAKYILCATADDIVQHIPTEDRHVWTQYSMLSRFFGERVGGVRFFEILNHHKLDPLVNYPVLELQHACLALGFQGMHRSSPNGIATLQQIQRDLYETLRRVRPKVMRDLSPRWQGQALAIDTNRVRVPVWVVGSTAAALLVALFVVLRFLLSGSAEAAAEATSTLHSTDKLSLRRLVLAPPPPPPPPPPAPEIIKFNDCIQFVPTATMIVIRLCGEFLFESGQADVKPGFKPVAADIARFLNGTPGKVKVVGHTDSTPIKTVRFPSNQVLSQERAKAVAAIIKQGMTDAARVETEGRGPDVPVAKNDTTEGRQKNRRVEVQVPRSQEASAQ